MEMPFNVPIAKELVNPNFKGKFVNQGLRMTHMSTPCLLLGVVYIVQVSASENINAFPHFITIVIQSNSLELEVELSVKIFLEREIANITTF